MLPACCQFWRGRQGVFGALERGPLWYSKVNVLHACRGAGACSSSSLEHSHACMGSYALAMQLCALLCPLKQSAPESADAAPPSSTAARQRGPQQEEVQQEWEQELEREWAQQQGQQRSQPSAPSRRRTARTPAWEPSTLRRAPKQPRWHVLNPYKPAGERVWQQQQAQWRQHAQGEAPPGSSGRAARHEGGTWTENARAAAVEAAVAELEQLAQLVATQQTMLGRPGGQVAHSSSSGGGGGAHSTVDASMGSAASADGDPSGARPAQPLSPQLLVRACLHISKLLRLVRLAPLQLERLQRMVDVLLLPALQAHLPQLEPSAAARVIAALGAVRQPGAGEHVRLLLEQAGEPHTLSTGAMLSILEGLRALQHDPGEQWLDAAEAAFGINLRRYPPRGVACALRAFVALRHAPQAWVMVAVVQCSQNHAARLTPSEAVGFLLDLRALGYVPPRRWLARYLQDLRPKLSGCSAKQLAALAAVLVWARAQPERGWGLEFLRRSAQAMPSGTSSQAAALLHAAVQLRLAPPRAWLEVGLRSLVPGNPRGKRGVRLLGARQLARVAHALAQLPAAEVTQLGWRVRAWLERELGSLRRSDWSALPLEELLCVLQVRMGGG